jgi:hypothetical protein
MSMLKTIYDEMSNYIWMYWDNKKHGFFGSGDTYKLGRCEHQPATNIKT